MTIERTENSHTWHPDVQFYSLKKDGKQKAFFYLDPYSRPAGVLQCALQGSSVNHTADVASRKLWKYRCHMYVDCRPFGRVSHAQKPFSRRCLQCGGSGKSLRQSIWVGSAGGMQVGVQKAESSQHARQLHEALQCHLDAQVCGGLRAEKHRGAWLDEVLGYVRSQRALSLHGSSKTPYSVNSILRSAGACMQRSAEAHGWTRWWANLG